MCIKAIGTLSPLPMTTDSSGTDTSPRTHSHTWHRCSAWRNGSVDILVINISKYLKAEWVWVYPTVFRTPKCPSPVHTHTHIHTRILLSYISSRLHGFRLYKLQGMNTRFFEIMVHLNIFFLLKVFRQLVFLSALWLKCSLSFIISFANLNNF